MAEILQRKLQAELEKYQSGQKELSKCLSARQKLEAQLTENTIVQEELTLLESTNEVYKLVGPVLVRQEIQEAKSTVNKRLDYINGEIKRYELQMTELEKRSEQHRETLGKLQQDFQRAQTRA